jgi:hypothetical protein
VSLIQEMQSRGLCSWRKTRALPIPIAPGGPSFIPLDGTVRRPLGPFIPLERVTHQHRSFLYWPTPEGKIHYPSAAGLDNFRVSAMIGL